MELFDVFENLSIIALDDDEKLTIDQDNFISIVKYFAKMELIELPKHFGTLLY